MKKLYESEKVRLTADEMNFTVEDVHIAGVEAKNAGEKVYRDARYFSTMDAALQEICRSVALRECADLASYVLILQNTWAAIHDMVKLQPKGE